MLVLEGLVGFIELFIFSFISIIGRGIDLDYCGIEWFALEMNRDHSVVFESAPQYCPFSENILLPYGDTMDVVWEIVQTIVTPQLYQ